ncbi:VasL domain-containing protein [Rahnella selenatireducens]|uniref:VasL domain-containing protein n=1 Tax=Rahnella selenatireducens TaxID=3389797 RepID=UPI003967E827
MSDETHIIKLGDDPRFLPEFNAIREEINKTNHPSQPEVNWRLVESLALTLFKSNGVDLHTATYYTLARTKINGLAGFCEGCELLAGLITAEWANFWPQNHQARTDMLEWFNTRIGNILRKDPSLALGDTPLLYRTERTLQLICDKLQQVELRRIPRVENLLYFMQNIRKRAEAEQLAHSAQALQYASPTLVYMPEPTSHSDPVYSPLPGLEPADQAPKVKVYFTDSENKKRTPRMPVACGFLAGLACAAIVFGGFWWQQVTPMQQQIAWVNDTPQGGAALWLTSPELKEYPQRLNRLLDTSPLQALETGEHLTKTAASVWPENELQQQATARWHNTLKLRAGNSPQLRGYRQVQQDLHEFAALLLQREKSKEGITLSYLKTVAYQAETLLNRETPVEALLTQLEEAKKQNQNTQALEKQINERIDAFSSRYLLIRNVGFPDNNSLKNPPNTHD